MDRDCLGIRRAGSSGQRDPEGRSGSPSRGARTEYVGAACEYMSTPSSESTTPGTGACSRHGPGGQTPGPGCRPAAPKAPPPTQPRGRAQPQAAASASFAPPHVRSPRLYSVESQEPTVYSQESTPAPALPSPARPPPRPPPGLPPLRRGCWPPAPCPVPPPPSRPRPRLRAAGRAPPRGRGELRAQGRRRGGVAPARCWRERAARSDGGPAAPAGPGPGGLGGRARPPAGHAGRLARLGCGGRVEAEQPLQRVGEQPAHVNDGIVCYSSLTVSVRLHASHAASLCLHSA